MADRYDLVIVGSGTAAQVASHRVKGEGWAVAVIDHRPFGGTCALRGCDPKKVLVSGAEAVDAARRMRTRGVEGQLRIAWPDLIAFKRTFTGAVPQRQEEHYRSNGIDAIHGLARFIGPNRLVVAGRELEARYVLIAAGAHPVPLGLPGEEHLITSEQFMALETLPSRIVMVGGGYIAAEFSHIAARAGAKVTVVQREHRLLTRFDPDLVGYLMAKFAELGIDVLTGIAVTRIEKTAGGYQVHAGREKIAADLVVHAAGRAPDLAALDLLAAGVAEEAGRLKLNEFLQSVSNPRIYAAGDAAHRGPPLTPVAGHDAHVVARNLVEGNRHRPDYRGVPSVAFTVPPIAAVGLSEEEARTQGLKFRVQSENAWDWYTARRLSERVYAYKTLIEEESARILGVHLVGPHAEEVINLFALAIRHGMTPDDLKSTIFAYPTGASDITYMI